MDIFRPYKFKLQNDRAIVRPLIKRLRRGIAGNRNHIVGANCGGLSPSNRLKCLNNRFK